MDVQSTGSEDERIIRAAEAVIDEAVEFTRELIRIPTFNPPGDFYEDGAQCIGRWLKRAGFTAERFGLGPSIIWGGLICTVCVAACVPLLPAFWRYRKAAAPADGNPSKAAN